jgi:hypothetical protein
MRSDLKTLAGEIRLRNAEIILKEARRLSPEKYDDLRDKHFRHILSGLENYQIRQEGDSLFLEKTV